MSVYTHSFEHKCDVFDFDFKTHTVQSWLHSHKRLENDVRRIFLVITTMPSECIPTLPSDWSPDADTLHILSCHNTELDPFFSNQYALLRKCIQTERHSLHVCLLDLPAHSQIAPLAKIRALLSPGSFCEAHVLTHTGIQEVCHSLALGHSMRSWMHPTAVNTATEVKTFALYRVLLSKDDSFERILYCSRCKLV